MDEQEIKSLLSTYDVLYLENVKYFFESPVNQLYRKLAILKQESYNANQRIVLIDTLLADKRKQHFYNYLQKIITQLDITNCFIMIITADTDVDNYLNSARLAYSHDQTCMQVEQLKIHNSDTLGPTNFDIPDSMCINPWIHLEIDIHGQIKPCCLYKKTLTNKSIYDYSLVSVINDNNQVQLKKQFLQGQRPTGCQKCWQDEDNGKISKRQHDNYVFRKKLFDVDYNNVELTTLVSLDVKLKNTCNLSCRICQPLFSSKWMSEASQHPEFYPQWQHLKNIKIEWTDNTNSNLWNDIDKIGDNLQYITFAGGEPLLDKSHVRMLEYFVNHNRSSQISLHYNTNGTVYADHLISLWNEFKYVELSFSIDNIESKFEYERYGSTWDTVIKNINRYKKLNSNIFKFNVYYTVTALNILDSYTVFQFCKDNKLPIALNILDHPEQLNIGLFNNKQKNYISTKLLSIQNEEFRDIIAPIVKSMNTRTIKSTVKDMINYLEITDKIRQQDFKKTYTELANILNWE